MKKTLALLLSLIIAFSCILIPLSYAASSDEQTAYPAIVVTGYASCKLYKDYGTKSQKQVWPFSVGATLKQTIGDIPNVIGTLGYVLKGDLSPLGKRISYGGKIILDDMFCNDYDGSSKKNVTHYPNDPALTNYTYLKQEDNGNNIAEPELLAAIAKKLGGENTFMFQYDFRMSAYDIADDLHTFIDAVLEKTGKSKTQLFGLSYGGLITGMYLSKYGTEGKVDNAVLNVPALGGTSFAERFVTGKIDLPMASLVTLAEVALKSEINLSKYFSNHGPEKLEELISSFLIDIIDLAINWGSLMDLLTPEDYEKIKSQYLDSEKNAELIRKSDYVHDVVMKNYRESFIACQKAGVKVSIIGNYGTSTAFGGDEIGDLLLDVKRVTGATVTKLGNTFENGYNEIGTNCSATEHRHISPSLEIDASTAYLPENTWFINDQCHGMYAFDSISFSLVQKLLFAKDEITVHSLPEYPQFLSTTNPKSGVDIYFNSSVKGYAGENDSKIIIKNLSDKHPVFLKSVACDGADIVFERVGSKILMPGKEITVDFTGKLPSNSKTHFTVKVEFSKPTSLDFGDSRVMDFITM